MNLDNYKAKPIHLLMSREFDTEKEHIMLISDDFKALCKAADAYNTIATIQCVHKHYYVYTKMAYYEQ